ncbi:MAG: enoyl-CoA hydratase/isomerase family protein [Phycisphaerales bacterium]|nr:enoyl-CoA hydratase/isomerase family protein [Planctomycetota bacterium]MCH8507687.1 enoyl-CoA hydratase/isomerase family protein [Phycisphaerales bacterium]
MIRFEILDNLAAVTLSRADKRNALTPDMLESLTGVFERMPGDIRAVVVSGDGPAFCAGFDLKMCAADQSGETMRQLLTGLSRAVRAMRAIDQPVVLAAHGAAVAGGCALLGGADIVVAERQTRLGYPVAKIGVSPAVSAPFLSSTIADGPARARLLDPDLICAEDARSIGLVHELADGPGATRERANDIARHLAAKPGIGVAATKALCNHLSRHRTDFAMEALTVSLSLAGSEEERERLAALWS